MPFSSEGLAGGDTRCKLEHRCYREGKHQLCQGCSPICLLTRALRSKVQLQLKPLWYKPARETLHSAWLFWDLSARLSFLAFFFLLCGLLFWVFLFVCFFLKPKVVFEYNSYFICTSSIQVFRDSMAALACTSGEPVLAFTLSKSPESIGITQMILPTWSAQ